MESTLYLTLEKIGTWMGAIAALALVWKIAVVFTKLQVTVDKIANNDLPHIYQEIKNLNQAIGEGNNGHYSPSDSRGDIRDLDRVGSWTR